MGKTNTASEKLFQGFGILVIICGIYFIVQKNYVEGILGIMVGALLLFQNRKKINDKHSE